MNKPSVSFKAINWIRQKNTKCVIFILVIIYFLISILFGVGYFILAENKMFEVIRLKDEQMDEQVEEENLSEIKPNIMDYIYFSFITASTIGYGDYYPTATGGKILVVLQSVFCSVYVAIMMSIITSKLLWPAKNTIIFSKKIIYDPQKGQFQVRIINTNSMPIINPEIRIAMTQHEMGDVIAGILELDNSRAKPIYLGKHDYVITFGIGRLDQNTYEANIILGELSKALNYQASAKKNNSRFRITITVSGSNELQNIAEIKKYYATDFVKGLGFVSIKYEEKDIDKLGIKYKKINEFWKQFESVVDENNLQ